VYIGDFHQLKKKFETKKDWRKKSAVFALKKRQKNCFCAQQHQPWTVKEKKSSSKKEEEGGQPSSSTGRTYNPPHPYNIFFIQNLF
jgi:hypothetical protein